MIRMFLLFFLILNLSPSANANETQDRPRPSGPGCGFYFNHYMRVLFDAKPSLAEFDEQYLLKAAEIRLFRDEPFKVSEVLGDHFKPEEIKNWKIKTSNLDKLNGKPAKIEIWNTQTHESKTISVPVNSEMHQEQRFFSQLKLSEGISLPKNKLTGTAKLTVDGYNMDRSLLAASLYYAPEELLHANPTFIQRKLYHLERVGRLQKILRGSEKIERLEDVLGTSGPTVSWTNLAKRADGSPTKDLFTYSYGNGLNESRLKMDELSKSFTSDDALNVFLLQIRDAQRSAVSNKAYALSFSFEPGAGKPLHYHYLNAEEMFSQLENKRNPGLLPKQCLNAPEDVRKYVEAGYRKRLNLTEAQLQQLMEISRSMQKRTDYVFLAEEPSVIRSSEIKPRWDIQTQSWVETPRTMSYDFDHFTVKGSMSLVYSSSEAEALPLELFTGVKIQRPPHGKVVEIGRFTVDPELRPLGPKQIWKSVAMVASKEGVGKIVAETTQEYATELIEKFGFKKIGERLNFEGKPEFIIEVTPETFFKKSILNAPDLVRP